MKKIALLILITLVSGYLKAQVNPGRSEQTTPVPVFDGDTLVIKPGVIVSEVILMGQLITINDTIRVANWKDTWFKLALDGSLKTSTNTNSVYQETPTEPGYYDYKVLGTNSVTGCSSMLSDYFRVLVLPALTATVTSPVTSVCAVPGSTVLLTANLPAGYAYNYQWTRNGVAIAGATQSTYNVSGETAVGNVTFGVDVSYSFAPKTTITPNAGSKTITVVSALPKPVITP